MKAHLNKSQSKKMSLSLSNNELKIIADQSGLLVSRYYIKTHIMERLYDLPEQRFSIPKIQENVPDSVLETDFVSPDTKGIYAKFFDDIFNGIPNGYANMKLLVKSSGYTWHHVSYSIVYDEENQPYYALITFFDNTEERKKELVSMKWHNSISSMLSESILYAEINLSDNTVERFEQGANLDIDLQSAKTLEDIIHYGIYDGKIDSSTLREYNTFFNKNRLISLFSEGVYEDHFNYFITGKDTSQIWRRANIGMIKYPYSSDIMVTVSFASLENHKKELERLTHKAFHDPLTGILNREGISKKTEELLAHFNDKNITAIFIIDLDDFKQVNDRLGHQTGDLLLIQVAETLQNAFMQKDIVGRLGGDEFMVIISGNLTADFLDNKAKELIEAMKLNLGERSLIPVSVSIGIAYGHSGIPFEKMYRTSDIALYSAKKAGKCRCYIINADTNEETSYVGEGSSSNLMSLQTLIEYADKNKPVVKRTPYEAILESIPGGVVFMEITDTIKIIHCNDWPTKVTGYTMEELDNFQEYSPLAIVHPDDIPAILEEARRLRNDADVCNMDYRIKHKDGHYIHFQMSVSLTERTASKAVFCGVQTDVSRILNVQQELEASESKLKALINAIPGSIAVFEIKNNQLKINHFGNWIYDFTGYTHEEVNAADGGSNLNTVHPEDKARVMQELEDIYSYKDTFRINLRLQHKNGMYKGVQIWGSVIKRMQNDVTMYTIYTEDDNLK